jgi:hypothetical protein
MQRDGDNSGNALYASVRGSVAVSPVAGVRGVNFTTPTIIFGTSAGSLGQASVKA